MTPAEVLSSDLAEAAQDLRDKEQPFAFATIIRTAGATAAKPGAKALLSEDGTILHGWLGGGCTKGAVKRAALEALQDGTPQFISVAPEDLLLEKGVTPGDEVDGTKFARNGCPSRGTVDIFIEPCLPMPQLVILGNSPVAQALNRLAAPYDWATTNTLETAGSQKGRPVVVIATQGEGDLDALQQALSTPTAHVAFVGSAKKYASLSNKLEKSGIARAQIDAVKAPAGLDIGAVTPEEIALSILAELVRVRRARAKRT